MLIPISIDNLPSVHYRIESVPSSGMICDIGLLQFRDVSTFCVCVFVRPGIAVSVMLQACCVRLFVATEVVASVIVRNVFTVYRYAMGSLSVQLCSVRCTCGPGALFTKGRKRWSVVRTVVR